MRGLVAPSIGHPSAISGIQRPAPRAAGHSLGALRMGGDDVQVDDAYAYILARTQARTHTHAHTHTHTLATP